MNIDRAKLQSCVERICRLLDERDELLADIRDIYTEAKSSLIVPKVLRKVVARKRAKDPSALQEEDDLLDAYLAALDDPTRAMVELAARGASSREIEQATGIDHATVARSVARKKFTATEDKEADSLTADAGRPSEPSAAAPQGVNACPPSGRVSPTFDVGQAAQSGNHSDESCGQPIATEATVGADETVAASSSQGEGVTAAFPATDEWAEIVKVQCELNKAYAQKRKAEAV